MIRARSGDDNASKVDDGFANFYAEHRQGVERYVRWSVGAMADVEDICAEVFCVALRRFDEIADVPPATARAWLRRVAVHGCLKEHRSRFRRDRAYRRFLICSDAGWYDPLDDGFLARLDDDGEVTRRAREVLASIPENHRQVLCLNMDGPLTGMQMAEALGVTQTAARLRVMRAKRAFGAEYMRRHG